jgi:hypothetical protein
MGIVAELAATLTRLMRPIGGIVLVVLTIWLVYRLMARRPAKRADSALASEIRCERHGIVLRLEAKTVEAYEQARFHVQCPLCAVRSARDISAS